MKIIKTVKLTKTDLTVLNSLRLDFIKKIQEEKELAKDIQDMNMKGLDSVKRNVDNMQSLYLKLYAEQKGN